MAGGDVDDGAGEPGTSPGAASKMPPDSPGADDEARRRPRAATTQPVASLADPDEARRRARPMSTISSAAAAASDVAEAEELTSLLDRATVDASVLKAKLMHSKNLSYAEKTQVTKKLFDTILMEGGMLPPQPELPSAAELAAQLSAEKEARAKAEAQLLEATTLARALEAQLRDARAQLTALQAKEKERADAKKEPVPVPALATAALPAAPSVSPRLSPRGSTVAASPPAPSSLTPQTPRRKTAVLSGAGATFGEALAELVGAAQDVPLFVSLATAYLEGAAASHTDLFVKPGDKTALSELRKAVQSGRYDLGSAEAHVVSDLLILFLDELPAPLIPAALAPLLAEASAIADSARRRAALRSVLWTAPVTARPVILHFMSFFHQLVTRPGAKLTARDVVRVAGPALFGLQRKKSDVGAHVATGALAALESVVQEGERALSWSGAGVSLDKSESALRVSGGTVEALLALAADAFFALADTELADVIVATHSYFATPAALFAALKEGVRVKGADAWQRRTRLFALSALRRWLAGHRRVFRRDKGLLKDAKSLVSHFKPDGDAEEEVHRALVALTSSSGVTFEGGSGGSELLAKRKVLAQKVELMSHKAADLAAQLTLIDWAMLREIASEELLHKNYTQAERRCALSIGSHSHSNTHRVHNSP